MVKLFQVIGTTPTHHNRTLMMTTASAKVMSLYMNDSVGSAHCLEFWVLPTSHTWLNWNCLIQGSTGYVEDNVDSRQWMQVTIHSFGTQMENFSSCIAVHVTIIKPIQSHRLIQQFPHSDILSGNLCTPCTFGTSCPTKEIPLPQAKQVIIQFNWTCCTKDPVLPQKNEAVNATEA